jgi:hypothetical protein
MTGRPPGGATKKCSRNFPFLTKVHLSTEFEHSSMYNKKSCTFGRVSPYPINLINFFFSFGNIL